MTKTCYKCKENKDLDEYTKNKSHPDGHQHWCKACFKQYRIDNIAKRRVYTKDYYGRGGRGGTPHTPTPSYHGMHARIKGTKGSASNYACAKCGEKARDWSYNHGCAGEVKGDTHQPYCYHINHYEPLCKPCHVHKDRLQGELTDNSI